MKRALLGTALLLLGSAACSEPRGAQLHGASAGQKGEKVVQDRSQGPAVSGLPFSQGQSFSSLDDYLAFLQKRGAYDVPWYREVRPGVYELVSRRGPGARPQVFTREELEKKFGFSR
jgi:hypothetical protein